MWQWGPTGPALQKAQVPGRPPLHDDEDLDVQVPVTVAFLDEPTHTSNRNTPFTSTAATAAVTPIEPMTRKTYAQKMMLSCHSTRFPL